MKRTTTARKTAGEEAAAPVANAPRDDAEKAAQVAAFGAAIVAWLAGDRPGGVDEDGR